MRSLLIPALVSLLAAPAFARASIATAYDDVSYPGPHATAVIAGRQLVPSATNDSGIALPDASSTGVAVRSVATAANPHDDAGLLGPELVPARRSAAVRVANHPTEQRAPCACTHA